MLYWPRIPARRGAAHMFEAPPHVAERDFMQGAWPKDGLVVAVPSAV